ncbi:hypothetical protein A6D6_02047 [Alcanivorax xiamenensis]|uniref:Pilus assembly protein Flp/PilA n=1 Tax=Alcanivorax xiamenensis TaxID=1177156 RepID=A0ABQ6Y8V6_9GAMM|nr:MULTISPECIES: hypothetical protein [Alcanivoracaceae]KAF0805786.1 hypothetical protein A6D6_02047 [Alcanivorax xiamenensis]SOC26395.1 pilus assembly protein Flp/PilA [Alloalcanivorax xenomutans]
MKLIQSINTATQFLMARLFSQMPTRSNRQRGASALEYIVLAAAIIIIVGLLAASGAGDKLIEVFEGLFDDAAGVSGPAAG